jgi:hypothetical protein
LAKIRKLNIQILENVKNSVNKSIKSKSSIKFISNMEDLYQTYFDSIDDVSVDTKKIFENLKIDDIEDDNIIKGFSTLANLEDRISELEQIGNSYKNDKTKFTDNYKNKINVFITSLQSDVNKYQHKIEKNIYKLENNKKGLKRDNKDKDEDEEILNFEKKITKFEDILKKIENDLGMKNEKLSKILKLFR